jgi:predicted N-acetyltransferase YhbS
MITICSAKLQDLEAIKAFYHQCGYGGGLKVEDLILTAWSESQMVGVVRLCPEYGATVLRGMQVLARFQRQGIGTRLLQACTEHLGNQLCYCIPWSHLHRFYQQGGFESVPSSEVPFFLRARLEGYLERGMQVSLMRRLPAK